MLRCCALVWILMAAPVLGQTVSYEATSLLPDNDGWIRLPCVDYCADRWLDGGWLVQVAEMVEGGPIPVGEKDSYRRELDEMAGVPTWFLQWRVITDAPPVYDDVGPVAVAAGGNSGVLYHFVIGDHQIRFLRDVGLPFVFVDIQTGVPHTYRLELVQGWYTLFVDGVQVDLGVPEGAYPTADSFVTFRGMASGQTTMVRWDYLRFGVIPQPNSGDYDSDGDVDQDDLYFFLDCLLGPDYDAAGPGCTWADMNNDGAANGADIAPFVEAMMW